MAQRRVWSLRYKHGNILPGLDRIFIQYDFGCMREELLERRLLQSASKGLGVCKFIFNILKVEFQSDFRVVATVERKDEKNAPDTVARKK